MEVDLRFPVLVAFSRGGKRGEGLSLLPEYLRPEPRERRSPRRTTTSLPEETTTPALEEKAVWPRSIAGGRQRGKEWIISARSTRGEGGTGRWKY